MPLHRRLPRLLTAALCGCFLACGHAAQYDPELGMLVRQSAEGTLLGPGDVFEVRVYREPDLSGVFQVAPDGTVDFPLLGNLRIEGLTSSQTAATLRGRLADGLLRDPFVTVQVKEFQSKRIYVLGQVERPGTFRYEEGMSVVQAVTLAGGFTKTSRPNATVVTRIVNGAETRSEVPVEDISRGRQKNFYLRPGDIVFVPESLL
jgi:polysaccharide export outer membrane protein